MIDLSFLLGKNYFGNNRSQHYLVCYERKAFSSEKKFKKKAEIIFLIVFVCFRFFLSKENIRNEHLSANAYSSVNIKFLYIIAVPKDEIFYVVFKRKRATFQ